MYPDVFLSCICYLFVNLVAFEFAQDPFSPLLQFYAEVAEAESWMKEKMPALTNQDLGKDEDSVQVLLKKLDALDLDIDNFQNNIGELAALSQGLLQRNHFDSANIKQQQVQLTNFMCIPTSGLIVGTCFD